MTGTSAPLPLDLRSPRTALQQPLPSASPPRLRHGWLLMLLVTALWWPLGAYWQSDDWIALHYAQAWPNVLHDFVGSQYGLQAMVEFYRPLITLSFGIEEHLFGADPFVAHLSNAFALGVSAWLLAGLVTRFFGTRVGVCAGLLWGALPLHAGSVLWAVGRVDSMTVPWILATLCLTVRAVDGKRYARLWAASTFLAALASKELAFVTPGLAALVAFAAAPPGRRLRESVVATLPLVAVLAAMLGVRAMVLGTVVGGYEAAPVQPWPSVQGLGVHLARTLDPALTLRTLPAWLPSGPWRVLGALPAVAGAAAIVRRRGRGGLATLAILVGAFVLAALPMFQLWADTATAMNARYFTLPAAALAIVPALGGVWTAVPALLVCALPWLETRSDWHEAHARARAVHELLRRHAADTEPGPWFVANVPRQTEHGVVSFHLGFDRVLAPPFGDGHHRLFALRPLAPRGDPATLDFERRGLPFATTLTLVDSSGLGVLPPRSLPAAKVSLDGPDHLTSEVLWAINDQRIDPAFVVTPKRPVYRITVFTAGGYVTVVLPDEPGDEAAGRVPLRRWLLAPTTAGTGVALDLRVPAVLDLDTTFPVWIEAGRLAAPAAGVAPAFVADAAAAAPLWLRFDRDYAELMRPRG